MGLAPITVLPTILSQKLWEKPDKNTIYRLVLLADFVPLFDSRIRVAFRFVFELWVLLCLKVNIACCKKDVSLVCVMFGGLGEEVNRE